MTTIVAHRGASHDAPENTIPAFQLAWQQGADAIEGDFRSTRDGHIVCMHDHDTRRTTGVRREIGQTTFSELRELDAGAQFGDAYRGTVIPTIAEVFATIPPGKKIYIEIKAGTEIIPGLLQEIKQAGLEPEQILFIAFDAKVIQACKTAAPIYKASWLCDLKTYGYGILKPSVDTVLATLQDIGADAFSSSKTISESFAGKIMEHGYPWHVWTVDDPEQAARFQQWGAASITTNVPAVMLMKNH